MLLGLLVGCGPERTTPTGYRAPEALPEASLPVVVLDTQRTDLLLGAAFGQLAQVPPRTIGEALNWHQRTLKGKADEFLRLLAFDPEAGPVSDSLVADQYAAFGLNRAVRDLFDSVAYRYPAGYPLFAQFEAPLRRYKAAFPGAAVPKLRTYITGYQKPGPVTMDPYLAATLTDTTAYLGIGLHYFMGPKFGPYPDDIPKYILRRCTPEHLLPGALLKLMELHLPPAPQEGREPLLSHMIRMGIHYYSLDVLAPDMPDSLKIGYTSTQTRFAEAYLKNIWNELLPELYDGELLKYRRWLDEAPYTRGLSQESPPRLGAYVGWQIVRSYMRRHPEMRLAELLRANRYEAILRDSGFRP